MLIQRLSNKRLDHSLPADIHLLRRSVEVFQHPSRRVHIYPLNRFHHPALVRKKARYILAFCPRAVQWILPKPASYSCRKQGPRLQTLYCTVRVTIVEAVMLESAVSVPVTVNT